MAAPVPSASSVQQRLQFAGNTLFAIAQQKLDDATQWDRIAALNGLSDPWLVGTGSLIIPPYNPAASGVVVFPSQG